MSAAVALRWLAIAAAHVVAASFGAVLVDHLMTGQSISHAAQELLSFYSSLLVAVQDIARLLMNSGV